MLTACSNDLQKNVGQKNCHRATADTETERGRDRGTERKSDSQLSVPPPVRLCVSGGSVARLITKR
jgi:hypothetical protein